MLTHKPINPMTLLIFILIEINDFVVKGKCNKFKFFGHRSRVNARVFGLCGENV